MRKKVCDGKMKQMQLVAFTSYRCNFYLRRSFHSETFDRNVFQEAIVQKEHFCNVGKHFRYGSVIVTVVYIHLFSFSDYIKTLL